MMHPVTDTWEVLTLPAQEYPGLQPVWMSGTPLAGPAGDWFRGIDEFVAADVDGDGEVEVVIFNNADLWTAVLKWQDGALVPVWMSPSPLHVSGPGAAGPGASTGSSPPTLTVTARSRWSSTTTTICGPGC